MSFGGGFSQPFVIPQDDYDAAVKRFESEGEVIASASDQESEG